ncbi:MAG: PH domain-containing protein [Owenweeksia sp.]
MLFENLQINPEELPQIEEVEFHKLEADYLWMRLTAWGIFFLVSAGILVFISFSTDVALWKFMAPWLGLLLLVLFLEIRGFRIKGYALRENDISYKSGLIFFSMTSIPLNRLQHCEVSQGPLGRLFDLASVKVYTAGGSYSDLSIGGLKKEAAHRLRDHITRLSAQYE